MKEKKSFMDRLKRFLLLLSRKYDSLQKDEIILGEDKKLTVSEYKRPDFNWMQMREIRLGLEKGLDVDTYAKANMNVEQMEEIRLGLEKSLDTSFYNKNEFDWFEMREIRLGLEQNLDVSKYAKIGLNADQMEEIKLGLEKGLDVSKYNEKEFDNRQMREIRLGLEKGLDTSFYDNSEVDYMKMKEIRLGLEQSVNIHRYLKESSAESMKENRLKQLEERTEENKDILKTEEAKKETEVEIKAETEAKEQNKVEEFEFNRFDATKVFGYILNAGGALTLEELQRHLKIEYPDIRKFDKQYTLLKARLEGNVKDGYLIKNEDKSYSISDLGIKKAGEINRQILSDRVKNGELEKSEEVEVEID